MALCTMQGHTHEQVLDLLSALQEHSHLKGPQILSFINSVKGLLGLLRG